MCDEQHVELSTAVTEHHNNRNSLARGSKKRTRLSGEEAAWTAARCNRILRTIDSRIVILQRLSNIESSAKNRYSREECPWRASVCTSALESEEDAETPTVRDPEWLPGLRIGVKNPRKTYSGKHHVGPAPQRGRGDRRREVCFSTPFVKRILRPGHELDLPHRTQPQRQDPPIELYHEPHRAKNSRHLPIKPTSMRDEAEKNLQSAFKSMLLQTQPKSEGIRTGSQSLMAACIRKIPSYIKLLDEEDFAENGTTGREQINEDNSDAVYMELEGLGSHSGWPQLREVVRAHCIQKLCDIISRGILRAHVVDYMVDACVEAQAAVEGQQIIRALVAENPFRHLQDSAGEKEDPYCVAKIKDFTSRTSSQDFEMRFLTHLLQHESAHLVFKTIDVPSHWKPLVQALLLPSSFGDAAVLFETLTLSVLKTMAGAETKNRHHSVMQGRMLYSTVILVAATIIGGLMEERVSRSCRQLEGLLKGIYLAIHTLLNESESVNNSWRGCNVLYALTISIVLIDSMQPRGHPGLVTINVDHALNSVRSIRGQSSKKEEPFHAIGDIARCVSRFDKDTGSQLWKHMISSLLSTCEDVSAQQLHIVQGLALDSAGEYDATHHRPGGSSFAEEVEAAIRQYKRGTASKTPVSKRMVGGFRWDAGLCEFVARTPFPLLPDSPRSAEIPETDNQDKCPQDMSRRKNRAGNARSRTALAVISPNSTRQQVISARDTSKVSQRDETLETKESGKGNFKSSSKRSILEARTETEEDKGEAQPDYERDELGMPTPANKKRRRQVIGAPATGPRSKQGGPKSSAPRRDTPADHAASFVDLSDDELGV